MAEVATKTYPTPEELWAAYEALQLTLDQKVAARQAAEAKAEQARVDGVYERALEIVGTVKWRIPWQYFRTEERFY
jgi:hypothetical protein